MSVIIYYQPVSPNKVAGGISDTVGALESIFGKLPKVLESQDVPLLKAMAAVCDTYPNPFMELAEAIKEHERINVWAVW